MPGFPIPFIFKGYLLEFKSTDHFISTLGVAICKFFFGRPQQYHVRIGPFLDKYEINRLNFRFIVGNNGMWEYSLRAQGFWGI